MIKMDNIEEIELNIKVTQDRVQQILQKEIEELTEQTTNSKEFLILLTQKHTDTAIAMVAFEELAIEIINSTFVDDKDKEEYTKKLKNVQNIIRQNITEMVNSKEFVKTFWN